MVKIGIIGLSEGNGHPFSFSAILNGYNCDEFKKTEWQGILHYLTKRDSSEIASLNAEVTHVWTQDEVISTQLSLACNINNIVTDYHEMLGKVNAIIIARDDYKEHLKMAAPFLEAGVPVFIDKPLTLDVIELNWFRPYLLSGLLMSCSGFRYASELDYPRQNLVDFGKIKLIRAAVINHWDKYGIHMVDALLGLGGLKPVTVLCLTNIEHDSMLIELDNDAVFQIDALGPEIATFSFDIYGTNQNKTYNISDNFIAFRRTLYRFIKQVETGIPAIPAEITELSIKTLIAGYQSKKLNRKINLSEIEI